MNDEDASIRHRMAAAKACAGELASAATVAKKVLVRRLIRQIAVETESIVIEARVHALCEGTSDELVADPRLESDGLMRGLP
jgi:hypothetical protein